MKGEPVRAMRILQMLHDLTKVMTDYAALKRAVEERKERMEIQWNDVRNLKTKEEEYRIIVCIR